jgi:sec-independent protein translocase protein TatA
MGDVAKGINSFKKGLNEPDDEPEKTSSKTIDHKAEETVVSNKSEDKSNAG